MTKYEVKHALRAQALLGECPTWSVETQALVWIDIIGCTINSFDPKTGHNRVYALPTMPGCFALRAGNGAIIAGRDAFYDIDLASGVLTRLIDAPYDSEKYRFNDGKPDRQGRLWTGFLPIEIDLEHGDRGVGFYYCYDGKTLKKGFGGVTVPNGTAFSPDGKTMYRAESFDRQIHAYEYDPATATPSNHRIFAEIPENLGLPDGATVDSEGGYWIGLNASPRGASIGRFTQDGKFDFNIEIPSIFASMVCFGGPNMSTLFITTIADKSFESYVGGSLGEYAGDIWSVEVPFKGIPETMFPSAK